MDRLLSVQDVAALLGISRASVYRLMEHEALPFVVVSSRTKRFKPTDIEAWLDRRTEQTNG